MAVHDARRPLSAGLAGGLAALAILSSDPAAAAGRAFVTGLSPGPTPFIENVTAGYAGATLTSASFLVFPKSGSYARPIVATYSAAYLSAHGLLNGGGLVVPVFGLYAGATNLVGVLASFADGTVSGGIVRIRTAAYADPCAAVNQPVLQQHRTATADLGYDYFMLKDYCSTSSPAIVDTDGNLRWVGTAGIGAIASTFYRNAFYQSDGRTGLLRMDLDGTVTRLADYAALGVTTTDHHNIDPGKYGLVVDVSTTASTESTDLEIDPNTGAVLNRFDLDRIISGAMVAGGDDPTQFVYPVGTDWFHNNATTYNPADNTLIVSSRENFVIAVDEDVPADGMRKIHWILGDPTKKWYQFASLRRFALQLGPGTLPPIGQHAVSIDHQGNLLLFDDGFGSTFQMPAGASRSSSAARSYRIDPVARTATEIFTYSPTPSLLSDFCGSVYEPVAGQYLVDFPLAHGGTTTELQGLGAGGKLVFDLQYPATPGSCGSGWNALPLPMFSAPITF